MLRRYGMNCRGSARSAPTEDVDAVSQDVQSELGGRLVGVVEEGGGPDGTDLCVRAPLVWVRC